MTDIVQRLRRWNAPLPQDWREEAAAEIERLRAIIVQAHNDGLEEAAQWLEQCERQEPDAIRALKEKQDD